MTKITIERLENSGKAILGQLSVDDGRFTCSTLEPLACIVPGQYKAILATSPALGYFTPRLIGVPGYPRNDVLIHVGNTPEETEGCILVGLVAGDNFVGQSRDAFAGLMAAIGDETELTVTVLPLLLGRSEGDPAAAGPGIPLDGRPQAATMPGVANWFNRPRDYDRRLFERLVTAVEAIAKELGPEAPFDAVKFNFAFGGKPMSSTTPVPLPDDDVQPIAVVGIDKFGALGALLAAGASIAIVTSDPTIAAFVPDASPLPQQIKDSSGNVIATVPSLISGNLVPTSPVKTGAPFTATYQITNADGTPGNTQTSEAFSLAAGVEVSESIVIGAAVPATPPATPAPASAEKTGFKSK